VQDWLPRVGQVLECVRADAAFSLAPVDLSRNLYRTALFNL
jgi:hypothetical protein